MPIHTRHHSDPNTSPNSLGDLPLIHRPETCHPGMLYTAHGGHVFRHDGEVLCQAQYISYDLSYYMDQKEQKREMLTLYSSNGFMANMSNES